MQCVDVGAAVWTAAGHVPPVTMLFPQLILVLVLAISTPAKSAGYSSAAAVASAGAAAAPPAPLPEQVTLSLTARPDEMIVSWISREPLPFPLPVPEHDIPCSNMHNNLSMLPVPFPFPSPGPLPGSVVRYGSSTSGSSTSATTVLDKIATNATLLFVSHKGGVGYRLVHNVVLRGLLPGGQYSYTVETAGGSRSAVGSFKMVRLRHISRLSL